MRAFEIRTGDGVAIFFVGSSSEFASAEDASVVMSGYRGAVMWIDWLESKRSGGGTALMNAIIHEAKRRDVRAIGLQAVPPNAPPDSAAVHRLLRFYARFGFGDRSDLASWSDFPVLILDRRSS